MYRYVTSKIDETSDCITIFTLFISICKLTNCVFLMHICNEKKNEEKNVKHPFEAHPLHEIQREQKMLNVIFFPMTVYKMTQEEKETFKINQVRL